MNCLNWHQVSLVHISAKMEALVVGKFRGVHNLFGFVLGRKTIQYK